MYDTVGTTRKPRPAWTTWPYWTACKLCVCCFCVALSPLLEFECVVVCDPIPNPCRDEMEPLAAKDPQVLMELQVRMEMLVLLELMDHQ